MGRQREMVACLEELGALAVAEGQAERATRLYAAAGRIRAAVGAPLPPMDGSRHGQSLASAEAGLDGAQFVAALAQGCALTLEEAVQYALEEKDPKGFGNL